MRVIDESGGKSRTMSDVQEKMSQFESDLDILLALSPLPPQICEKLPVIVNWLLSKGVRMMEGYPINTKYVRDAFGEVGLNKDYIWCNTAVFYISHWRPASFEAKGRELLKSYYLRALQAFFARMNKSSSDGETPMANMWTFQAILKLIIICSSYLTDKHYDFCSSLHSQKPATESAHCNFWNTMASEENWTFE
jgi:hypothetical protein